MPRRAVAFRYTLVVEPAGEAMRELDDWLKARLGDSVACLLDEPGRGVVIAVAATSRARRMAAMVDALETLRGGPVSLRLGARLEFIPSREAASTVILPADCRGIGVIAAGLSRVIPPPGGALAMAQWVRPHVVVAETRGERLKVPVRRVEKLPSEIRGPFDAVRLGLYCSQITAEGKRTFQLAQIELPVEAAVR